MEIHGYLEHIRKFEWSINAGYSINTMYSMHGAHITSSKQPNQRTRLTNSEDGDTNVDKENGRKDSPAK